MTGAEVRKLPSAGQSVALTQKRASLTQLPDVNKLRVDEEAGYVENCRLSEHTLDTGIFKLPPQKLQEFQC